jgi:hypothetical protein
MNTLLSQRIANGVYVVAAALFFTACAQRHVPSQSRIEKLFDTFYAFHRDATRDDPTALALASRVVNRYRLDFAAYQTPATVQTVGTGDLSFLFRAADIAFSYAISGDMLDDMQLDVDELHRRGITREDRKFYAALIENRLFDRARAFAQSQSLGSIEIAPHIRDATTGAGPTALFVKNGGRVLVRQTVDLSNNQIVVVSSPFCHFSQRAVRSLEHDAALAPLFRDHALWIVPPDEGTPFSSVADWNQAHPIGPMKYTYRREEWPMVDRWETPVFYFFRNGHVVGKVTGWPKEGHKAEIRQSLKAAGLI